MTGKGRRFNYDKKVKEQVSEKTLDFLHADIDSL